MKTWEQLKDIKLTTDELKQRLHRCRNALPLTALEGIGILSSAINGLHFPFQSTLTPNMPQYNTLVREETIRNDMRLQQCLNVAVAVLQRYEKPGLTESDLEKERQATALAKRQAKDAAAQRLAAIEKHEMELCIARNEALRLKAKQDSDALNAMLAEQLAAALAAQQEAQRQAAAIHAQQEAARQAEVQRQQQIAAEAQRQAEALRLQQQQEEQQKAAEALRIAEVQKQREAVECAAKQEAERQAAIIQAQKIAEEKRQADIIRADKEAEAARITLIQQQAINPEHEKLLVTFSFETMKSAVVDFAVNVNFERLDSQKLFEFDLVVILAANAEMMTLSRFSSPNETALFEMQLMLQQNNVILNSALQRMEKRLTADIVAMQKESAVVEMSAEDSLVLQKTHEAARHIQALCARSSGFFNAARETVLMDDAQKAVVDQLAVGAKKIDEKAHSMNLVFMSVEIRKQLEKYTQVVEQQHTSVYTI